MTDPLAPPRVLAPDLSPYTHASGCRSISSADELGWSNALTITLQQFGIPAELVEGKSKAYRQVAPRTPMPTPKISPLPA